MEEVIRLKTKWTLDQLLAAEDYHSCQLKNSWLGVLGFFINVVSVVFLSVALWPVLNFYFFVIVALILVFARTEKACLKSLINAKKMLGSKDIEVEWEIGEKRITATIEELTNSNFSWDLISKIVQTPSGFMVYFTDEIFYCLPNQAFLSEFDCQRFTELALAKEKLLVRLDE